jgi:hypothetical protein
LNLVDPAEYLSTVPLAQRTWRFAVTRVIDARAFAAYEPYTWSVPWWLRAATWVTLATVGASLLTLAGYAFSRSMSS